MATTTFSGPVVSNNGFTGFVQVTTYTVATLPAAAASNAGVVAYASDARKAAEGVGACDDHDQTQDDDRWSLNFPWR